MSEETKTADVVDCADGVANPFRSPSSDKPSSPKGSFDKQSRRSTLREESATFRIGMNSHHTTHQNKNGTENTDMTNNSTTTSISSRRRPRSVSNRSSSVSVSERLLMPFSGNNEEEEEEKNGSSNHSNSKNDETNIANANIRGSLAPSRLVHRKRTPRDTVASHADEVSISDCSSSYLVSDSEIGDRTTAADANVLDQNNSQTDADADRNDAEPKEESSIGLQPLNNTSQRTVQSFFSLNDLSSTGTISSLSVAENDDSYEDCVDDDGGTRGSNTDGEEEEKKYFNDDEHKRRMEITFASSVAEAQQQHQHQHQHQHQQPPGHNRRSRGRSLPSGRCSPPDDKNEQCEGSSILTNGETDNEEFTTDEGQPQVGEEFYDDFEEDEEYVLNIHEHAAGYDKEYVEEYIIESVNEKSVLEEQNLKHYEDGRVLLVTDDGEEWEEEVEEGVGDGNDNDKEGGRGPEMERRETEVQ
eukprot:jgi/Psemu1/327498/estExt_fgenesh1_pg.C_6850003